MPRLAANLSMLFTELPFAERFAAAARAGFKAVEFTFPYEHGPDDIAQWLHDSNLKNVLFNMPPGDPAKGERGLASLPGREEEFQEGVALALRYARAFATPRLHIMAGIVPQGASRSERIELYVSNLRYAAQQLGRHGITATIEPINGRDMPGYLLQNQAEAHAIREQVGEPNLKVQMDLYHAQIMEGDLTMKLRRYIGEIGHIQIAGVPDRHEPDRGELNAPFLLNLIDELGYEGWVGCEYRPRGTTLEGLRWIEELEDRV